MKPKKKPSSAKAFGKKSKKSASIKPMGKHPNSASSKPQKPTAQKGDTRNRSLATLALMRREGLSLSEASRRQHIKPATVRRNVGGAVRQDKPGGRFSAKPGDTFRRDLQIYTAQGLMTVPVYGSKNATFIANYLNAVGEFLRTHKSEKLEPFKGKTIKIEGKDVELLTDPEVLKLLDDADLAHVDQLYADVTGGAHE